MGHRTTDGKPRRAGRAVSAEPRRPASRMSTRSSQPVLDTGHMPHHRGVRNIRSVGGERVEDRLVLAHRAFLGSDLGAPPPDPGAVRRSPKTLDQGGEHGVPRGGRDQPVEVDVEREQLLGWLSGVRRRPRLAASPLRASSIFWGGHRSRRGSRMRRTRRNSRTLSSRWKSTTKVRVSSRTSGSRLVTYVPSPWLTSRMLIIERARTASRSELRDTPSAREVRFAREAGARPEASPHDHLLDPQDRLVR